MRQQKHPHPLTNSLEQLFICTERVLWRAGCIFAPRTNYKVICGANTQIEKDFASNFFHTDNYCHFKYKNTRKLGLKEFMASKKHRDEPHLLRSNDNDFFQEERSMLESVYSNL